MLHVGVYLSLFTTCRQSSLQTWHTPLSRSRSSRRSAEPPAAMMYSPSHLGLQNSRPAPCSMACDMAAPRSAHRHTICRSRLLLVLLANFQEALQRRSSFPHLTCTHSSQAQ